MKTLPLSGMGDGWPSEGDSDCMGPEEEEMVEMVMVLEEMHQELMVDVTVMVVRCMIETKLFTHCHSHQINGNSLTDNKASY